MADNLTTQAATLATIPTSSTIATDDVGGAHYQRVKLDLGGDGASSPAVTTVPVSGTVSVTEPVSVDDNGASLTIDAASLPLPTGASTSALQTQPGVDIGDVTVNNAAGAAAVNIQDGGNAITVDGTVAVSSLPALVAGAANIGDVDVLTVPAPLSTTGGGVEATALRVTLANDSTGLVSVDDNAGSLTVDNATISVVGSGTEATAQRVTIATDSTGLLSVDDNAGSLTVDAPIGTPVNVQIGNATLAAGVIDETGASAVDALAVGGGTAHDAVDSGNPLKIGAKAVTAVPTAVAVNDRVNAWADVYGRQLVQQGVPVGTERWATAQYTGAQTGVALLTPTSTKKLVITYVQIQVGGTTAGTLQVWFGGSADTTYSRGTDRAIFDGEFAPSATLKPGFTATKESGWAAIAADDVLRVTDSAAINPLTVTVWGYEV